MTDAAGEVLAGALALEQSPSADDAEPAEVHRVEDLLRRAVAPGAARELGDPHAEASLAALRT